MSFSDRVRGVRTVLESAPRGVMRSHPGAEPSDPPPSIPPPLARVSKNWGALIGLITGALVLVDVGVRVAERNDAYATTAQLNEIKGDVKEIKKQLDALRIEEIKPLIAQANTNALDAEAKVDAANKQLTRITRAINGFNLSQSARGRITPLPLQDP